MGLDQLLTLTSQVSTYLLPIIGCIVLVFLALFFKHLIDVLKQAKSTLVEVEKTLITADRQLNSLDKPLNTLNELSDTIDTVHEAGKHAVRSSLVMALDNLANIRDWLLQKIQVDKDEEVEDYE